eukprot:m.59418 g.59418  ORF g.59418 m.59418 type:complete len:517 (-) comp49239_c0_seq4:61-1611(-)
MLAVFVVLFAGVQASTCRFAVNYTSAALWSADTQMRFLDDVFTAEGAFHQHRVGYNALSGFTYDGHMLDYTTGELLPGGLHNFSAPSKECPHLTLLALALSGNPLATRFVMASANTTNVTQVVADILERKISTYERFNASHPGFGGFLPWVSVGDDGVKPIAPSWTSQVPALDNGEMIWGMYTAEFALRQNSIFGLADRYKRYLDYLRQTAQIVFYRGGGNVSWVTSILDVNVVPHPGNYFGQSDPGDPYEGELFTWFLDLMTEWQNPEERELMWIGKRSMLQAVNYTTHSGENITVQRGFWFSSHENWKLSMLPYLDIDICNRIFANDERARSVHSAENNIAGLYACVNDVTAGPGKPIPDYIGNTGIQSLAFMPNQDWRSDVVTPYGIFPMALSNRSVAIQWYHNMLLGPRMQGPYGSTEAVNLNGTEISPLLTWDSKITSLMTLSGGAADLLRQALQLDGYYDRFAEVVEREYGLAFGSALAGEDIAYGLPSARIPTQHLHDFTHCTAASAPL